MILKSQHDLLQCKGKQSNRQKKNVRARILFPTKERKNCTARAKRTAGVSRAARFARVKPYFLAFVNHSVVILYTFSINLHLSAHHAQCLKPLNCRCKHNKTFFPKLYFTFLCNETTSKFILKQLDYSLSFSTSDSQLGCASLTICS